MELESTACRLAGDALLHSSLETVNTAVLSDAGQAQKQQHEGSASQQRPGSPVTPLEPQLAQLLSSAGRTNCLEKVPIAGLPFVRQGAVTEASLQYDNPPVVSRFLHKACISVGTCWRSVCCPCYYHQTSMLCSA